MKPMQDAVRKGTRTQRHIYIAILADESTTLNQKSTFSLCERNFLSKAQIQRSVNHSVDLIELSGLAAEGIFTALMSSLKSVGV
jgi:hypothetical protein